MGEKPIFTCKAHVFHIDQKTRKSWIPASKDAVDVSFFYDAGRNLYRILSTDKNQCIINSTITPTMNFTKTSQKFGQWTDTIANTVYGVGFASEAHMEEFVSQFETSKSFVANSNTSPATSSAKNVNTSTLEKPKPPTTSASPVSNRNSTGPSLSESNAKEIPQENGNSITVSKNVSVTSNDSPMHRNHVSEKSTAEEHSSDMEQKYEMLKLENDKLRKALAFSAVNAKKWEHELTTVKNHNARLTSALQESTSNVEEWKKQLQILKDENARFKKSQVDGHILHENYGTLQKDTHLRSDEQKQLIMKFEEDKLRLQSAIKLHLQDKESMRESYQMNQKQLISLEQQISQKMNDLNLLFRDMRAVLSHDIMANK